MMKSHIVTDYPLWRRTCLGAYRDNWRYVSCQFECTIGPYVFVKEIVVGIIAALLIIAPFFFQMRK